MNKAFEKYAQIYDLINHGKPYGDETNYILDLASRYQITNLKTLLELGCGTGQHSQFFSNAGIEVMGVDISSTMIDIARSNNYANCTFEVGDVRNFTSRKCFDLAVSLFHVMSYQTTYKDLNDTFSSINSCLSKDGLLIFDFWYGPGVLSTPPENRVREFKGDNFEFRRIATPTTNFQENTVAVNFDFIINNDGKYEEFSEVHLMRYWFLEELKHFLALNGFEFLEAVNWMTLDPLYSNPWVGAVIAKKWK